MNNIIILGCGRSGTSMIAGAIATGQKYNMGGKLHPPDKFNEKGYFETNFINKINDDILKLTSGFKSTNIFQGWLGAFDANETPYIDIDIQNRINDVIKTKPYLIKDPRLSYTLSSWLPCLNNDVKFIVCFRHPSEFLSSLIYHCQDAEYLKKIIVDKDFFENVWISMNQYILINYKYLNPLFINYNQVLYGNGLDILSSFIGEKLDKNFPSSRLRNARRGIEVKQETLDLYGELCNLACCEEELR